VSTVAWSICLIVAFAGGILVGWIAFGLDDDFIDDTTGRHARERREEFTRKEGL